MAKGKGKAAAARKGAAGGPRAPAARISAQQLYEQAQLALKFDDFDSARMALRKAVKMEPKNVEYVDALGALLAEVGPEEEAVEVLKQSVVLSPDTGYEKYLYLGQLLESPEDALAATRKGVSVLQATHAAAQAAASKEAPLLSKALAAAMCSLCEMLMGLAAARDQEERERQAEASGQGAGACGGAGPSGGGAGLAAVAEEVEHMLSLASTADPNSPEPGQALASLRYEQGRPAEALEALKRSMALWYTPSAKEGEEEDEEGEGAGGSGRGKKADGDDDEAMEDASGSGSGDGSESGSEDEDDGSPSYEFRIESAKLLLELEDTTSTAIDVLEGLIEEDDRVPDAWHLLALAYYSGHQYSEAAEVLAKGQALLKAMGAGPEDDITHVFSDLESAIKEALALEGQQPAQ
ncbi:hypothetical protein HYH03_016578 [Edaphochlamys debaryana]|uniref:Uncharacterized protein n=1 Tax=Edaphochlamys debaryana TaxID=47281 RepID=A0A835XR93_9CHLO|nr:hypothetical protein HYH03_016578 [Edaphochlamys debaryana]|eukprot:KAG2484624.1 hypothetical protein HYH03_016578 [Edaphochlamys debaryana]